MIYVMENAGHPFIVHWFLFMIANLRTIPESSLPALVYYPLDKDNDNAFHFDTFKIIESKYKYTVPSPGSITQNIGYEKLLYGKADIVDPQAYMFLRNLFNSFISSTIPEKPRYVYISRKDSTINNPRGNNIVVRQIVNEDEFAENLKSIGFEIIELSNYPLIEKFRIFQTASIVVSPHGSALIFAVCANPNMQLIEILPEYINDHDHYKHLCSSLNVSYKRFSDVTVVGENPGLCTNWNMRVNVPALINTIQNTISKQQHT